MHGGMWGLYLSTWVQKKWLNMECMCEILGLDLLFSVEFIPESLSESAWIVHLDVIVCYAFTTDNMNHHIQTHPLLDNAKHISVANICTSTTHQNCATFSICFFIELLMTNILFLLCSNQRFTQYLASNNCSFNLSGFIDKGGVQGQCMWILHIFGS